MQPLQKCITGNHYQKFCLILKKFSQCSRCSFDLLGECWDVKIWCWTCLGLLKAKQTRDAGLNGMAICMKRLLSQVAFSNILKKPIWKHRRNIGKSMKTQKMKTFLVYASNAYLCSRLIYTFGTRFLDIRNYLIAISECRHDEKFPF